MWTDKVFSVVSFWVLSEVISCDLLPFLFSHVYLMTKTFAFLLGLAQRPMLGVITVLFVLVSFRELIAANTVCQRGGWKYIHPYLPIDCSLTPVALLFLA